MRTSRRPRFHPNFQNGHFLICFTLLFVVTYWIANFKFLFELENTLLNKWPPRNKEADDASWDIPLQVLPSIDELMTLLHDVNGVGGDGDGDGDGGGGRGENGKKGVVENGNLSNAKSGGETQTSSSTTLVGYYTFIDSKACHDIQKDDALQLHHHHHLVHHPRIPFRPSTLSSLSSSSFPPPPVTCIIHYPFLDVQDYKEDEAAHHSPFEAPQNMSLLERVQQQQQQGMMMAHAKKNDMITQNKSGEAATVQSVQSVQSLQQERQEWIPNATNGRALLNPNCAILTRRGYRGGSVHNQINQDRLFLLFPYYVTYSGMEEITISAEEENIKQRPSLPMLLDSQQYNFVMGIFDGHGDWGHKVSHLAVVHFPKLLSQALESLQSSSSSMSQHSEHHGPKKALLDTFAKVDDLIPNPIGRMGGCTASIILRLNTKLYIANVGDSQSFIAAHVKSTKSTKIVYVTRRDKPLLDGEKSRIEALGGKITGNGPLSSRVVIRRPGLGAVTLAMSRSMGDFDGRNIGVISEPIVDVLDIPDLLEKHRLDNSGPENDVELFAVTASDGIFDFIPKEEVAEYLSKSLYHELETNLSTAVENLILESSHRWIKRQIEERDDISIAVQRIIINPS